jgi:hypothetical protein
LAGISMPSWLRPLRRPNRELNLPRDALTHFEPRHIANAVRPRDRVDRNAVVKREPVEIFAGPQNVRDPRRAIPRIGRRRAAERKADRHQECDPCTSGCGQR